MALVVLGAIALLSLGVTHLVAFRPKDADGSLPMESGPINDGKDEFPPFPSLFRSPKVHSGMLAIALNCKGDARCRLTLTLNEIGYKGFRSLHNPVSYLRRLGLGKPNWEEIQHLKVESDDSARTVTATWLTLGRARRVDGGRWEVSLEDEKDLTVISARDNEAVFNASSKIPGAGQTLHLTLNILVPPGSKDLKVREGEHPIVEFRAPGGRAREGVRSSAEFTMEAKPHILGCLAKMYASRKFSDLWAARAVFKNGGDQTLYDYSVRFRIEGFTGSWSTPRRAAELPPGATIVDPYYPILDLDKIVKLDGTRDISLEAEYSYRLASGERISRTESRPVKLLSRNQAMYSSIPESDQLTWQDKFDNVPRLLSAMCSYEDPAMQRIAVMVSELAGGDSFSGDRGAAERFMKALYEFMAWNLTYHTPPGGTVDGFFTQHVKYGRDVLRNKGGTCIDLAIFYATICQAVGLRPVLCVIKGHCFPAVILPEGGGVLAVETTGIGRYNFRHAKLAGEVNYQKAQAGPSFIVDVRRYQENGVDRLDLSPLGGDPQQWGIVAARKIIPNVIPLPDPRFWWRTAGKAEDTNIAAYLVRFDDITSQVDGVRHRGTIYIRMIARPGFEGVSRNLMASFVYDSDSGRLVIRYQGAEKSEFGRIVWNEADGNEPPSFKYVIGKTVYDDPDAKGKVRTYTRDRRVGFH